MRSTYLFNFLILLSAFLACYSGFKTARGYISYQALSEKREAKLLSWEVFPVEKGFVLKASYRFTINGKSYPGSTLFERPVYLSPWAAENAKETLQKKDWQVFYEKNHPENNSLHKGFPFRDSVHFILGAMLALYFWILKTYFHKRKAELIE